MVLHPFSPMMSTVDLLRLDIHAHNPHRFETPIRSSWLYIFAYLPIAWGVPGPSPRYDYRNHGTKYPGRLSPRCTSVQILKHRRGYVNSNLPASSYSHVTETPARIREFESTGILLLTCHCTNCPFSTTPEITRSNYAQKPPEGLVKILTQWVPDGPF